MPRYLFLLLWCLCRIEASSQEEEEKEEEYFKSCPVLCLMLKHNFFVAMHMQEEGRLPPSLLRCPDFPSLRNNSWFANIWRVEAAASLSAVMGQNDFVMYFPWCLGEKHDDLRSDTCTGFVIQVGMEALLNASVPPQLRGLDQYTAICSFQTSLIFPS